MTPVISPRCDGVRLFYWARVRTWRASLRELLRMPAKLVVLLATWAALAVGLSLLSYRGMRFLYDTAGLGPFLLNRLWFLFLFVVMMMLAVSQLANVYSTLMRAPETRWWMTLPISARTLCRAKWLESSLYSSWAVVLFAAPMWLAYLLVLQAPVWQAWWAPLVFLIPLIGIATACSTILLLGWLRWTGRIAIPREAIPIGFVAACGLLFWLLGEQRGPGEQDAWFVALQGLLPRMRVAMSWWLPSCWAAAGLQAVIDGDAGQVARTAALLWTTALICWRALDHAAAGWLLPVLRRHAHTVEIVPARRASSTGFRTAAWMRRPLLALLRKDVLLLIRDPMQWSQAVVFFGLLGAYFANIHRLSRLSVEPSWRMAVASLNLACTLLVFGSLAVRFLFPQMSLEGRSLWLLRIAPGGMRLLLASKLYLYGTLAVLLVEGLMALSLSRLGIPMPIRWWLSGVGAMAALTIVWLTVGLGAYWVDVDAQDAARVVSSSNGALALVAMLGYVGAVVAALVAAWTEWLHGASGRLVMVTVGLVSASLIAGLVPIQQGLARLERLDDPA